jgi:hypothetical protein
LDFNTIKRQFYYLYDWLWKKKKKKTREFSAGGLKSEASCLSAMADRDAGENWKEAACHCSIAPCSTKAVRDPHIKKVSAVEVRDKGCKIKTHE